MDPGYQARRIAPMRSRVNALNAEDRAFKQAMEYTGVGKSEVKKSTRSHTSESNYRQYIPYGPYDDEYHKHNGTPELEVGEGKGRFIADKLVMFSLSTDEIRDRLKADAIQKANIRSTKDEFIGVPMMFSPANINLPAQTHDPYCEPKDVPRGQHRDKNHRDYVPTKAKVAVSETPVTTAVAAACVNDRGTPNSAQYTEEFDFSNLIESIYVGQVPIPANGILSNDSSQAPSNNAGAGAHLEASSFAFGHPSVMDHPGQQLSNELVGRLQTGNVMLFSSPLASRHPNTFSPDNMGSIKRRKVKTYSINDPNKKRKYKWKDGKAPVRRLGHVNYPEGHEFHNFPKRGAYVVEKQGEDEVGDEGEGEGEDENMDDFEYGD